VRARNRHLQRGNPATGHRPPTHHARCRRRQCTFHVIHNSSFRGTCVKLSRRLIIINITIRRYKLINAHVHLNRSVHELIENSIIQLIREFTIQITHRLYIVQHAFIFIAVILTREERFPSPIVYIELQHPDESTRSVPACVERYVRYNGNVNVNVSSSSESDGRQYLTFVATLRRRSVVALRSRVTCRLPAMAANGDCRYASTSANYSLSDPVGPGLGPFFARS